MLSNILMQMAQGGAGAPPAPPINPPIAPPAPKMSKGQLIMGILADALAGAAGKQGAFAQQIGKQREREQEVAQWGLKRQGERDDKMWEWQNKPQDVAPMVRDAQAWLRMGPEQQAAYRASQAVRPQFIPDGYGGGQWAAPPAAGAMPPAAPKGVTFTPLGGSTPKASNNFR